MWDSGEGSDHNRFIVLSLTLYYKKFSQLKFVTTSSHGHNFMLRQDSPSGIVLHIDSYNLDTCNTFVALA